MFEDDFRLPNSSGPRRIFIYGFDPILLNTRLLLLEHAGHEVTTANDANHVRALMRGVGFALLVICHSVPLPQQSQITQDGKLQLPFLQVPALLPPETFLEQVKSIVASMHGPDRQLNPGETTTAESKLPGVRR
jgi:hypothetical protein